jgi:hypothetical protein
MQRRRYQTQARKRYPHFWCNQANFLRLLPSQDIETTVLKHITAATEYNHWIGIRAWILCLVGHKQRGSSQIQKKMVLVLAQDLVGLCSGGRGPSQEWQFIRSDNILIIVLAPQCVLDKARINLKKQRRRYQTQERKRYPHFWCNWANFLPLLPSQDIETTPGVLQK